MKSYVIIACVVMGIAGISCASHYSNLSHADKVADISKIMKNDIKNDLDAEKILNQYTVGFRITNPLIGPSSISNSVRRVDPSHEDQI
ncbi:MAG: hypothetical protein WCU00_13770, partial [Candidatus Latescibacterota bacterium]